MGIARTTSLVKAGVSMGDSGNYWDEFARKSVDTPANDGHGVWPGLMPDEDQQGPYPGLFICNDSPRDDALDDSQAMKAGPVSDPEPSSDDACYATPVVKRRSRASHPEKPKKAGQVYDEKARARYNKLKETKRAEQEQLHTQNTHLLARNAALEREVQRLR